MHIDWTGPHSSRRALLQSGLGLGAAALASLIDPKAFGSSIATTPKGAALPHFAPKAKRVIYLFQSGGPSHIDLFDDKPALAAHHGKELPATVRMGQRITGMTSGQKSFPCVSSLFKFAPQGQSGIHLSELLPHTAKIADEITLVRSVHTEAINHDPATTYIQTGSQQPGRPSLGAWLSYGLGSETAELPAFVVLISQGSGNRTDQPIFSRLWGAGFLPSQHQGVRFRGGVDPVLYLSNPPGVDSQSRRAMLDGLSEINRLASRTFADPEIDTRISQYEMAFRMQSSVPELTNLASEPRHILNMYGLDESGRGSSSDFARNCLMARRLVERGVRFVQLMHRGWDQHGSLPKQIRGQCLDTDQASAALVLDLKQRGLLDDTLVIWGGEFGRTVYSQGALTKDNYGRDHHGRCFSVWLAGGGMRRGHVHGQTDDFCYNITKDPVHIHDLNATILHCLGIDHTRLTYFFQGRDFRLTDVHGEVVRGLLA